MKKDKSWIKTFKNALEGCSYAFRTQRNFQVHLIISVSVVILALMLKVTPIEFSVLILAIIFGWVVEMANTAIEKTVDLITEEFHPKAKIAKDVSAGMMLIAAVGLSILALVVFLPHIL